MALLLVTMGEAAYRNKICRTDFHRILVVAVASGLLLARPAPNATGFSVRDLSTKRTIAVAGFGTADRNGEISKPLVPLDTTLEKENGIRCLATSVPKTKTISVASDLLGTASTPEADSFSEFASSQTPILAELLGRDDDESERFATTGLTGEKEDTLPLLWKERFSEWAVVGLATFALVEILGDLLSNYEWIQTLRYFWPLSLGAYYGLLWNQANDQDSSLRRKTMEEFGPAAAYSPNKIQNDDNQDIKTLLLQIGYVVGGFGLFVGGLADAVLPVWMTGPNWITNAGLAPDCAVLLLVLSVGDETDLFGTNTNNHNKNDDKKASQGANNNLVVASWSSSSNNNRNNATTGMAPLLLLKITLWAELYKLGEGSLDEIFSNLQTILSSSTV